VLISGASIAGPALAFWLARYGADVTVVESAPALRTGGQLVDVRGTARGVLDRAGLDERTDGVHVTFERAPRGSSTSSSAPTVCIRASATCCSVGMPCSCGTWAPTSRSGRPRTPPS
jgi:2-polyprenyl-6-methoxyphenol hydroxylase-like FAD-dependent oxidoreductase